LANRCLARELTAERQRKVYDIEDSWYKGRHPLTYEEHEQQTTKHLQLLREYRDGTKYDFDSIDTKYLNLDSYPSKDQLSFFSDTVFKLSKKCSDHFISVCASIMQSI